MKLSAALSALHIGFECARFGAGVCENTIIRREAGNCHNTPQLRRREG